MNSTQLCSLIDNKLSELTDIVYKFGVPKYNIDEFSSVASALHLVMLGDIKKFQLVKKHIVYSRLHILKLFKCKKLENDKEKIYYITKLLLYLLISPIVSYVEPNKIEYYIYSYQYFVATIINMLNNRIESRLMDFNILIHLSSVNMSKLGISKELITSIHEQIKSISQLNDVKLSGRNYYCNYNGIMYSTVGVYQSVLNTDNTMITQLLNYKNISNLHDSVIDMKYIPIPGDVDQVIKVTNCEYCYCIKLTISDLSNYAFWNYKNLEYEFLGFTKFPMVLKTTETTKLKPYLFRWNNLTLYSTWNGQVDPLIYMDKCPYAKTSGILIKNNGKYIKIYFYECTNSSKGFTVSESDIVHSIEWLKQSRLFKLNKNIKKIIININHNSTYQSYMQDIIGYCRCNMINTTINLVL